MKNSLKIIVFVLAGILLAAGSGGGVWWWMQRNAPAAEAVAAKPAFDKKEYKYLSLEKVIVMLRGATGDQQSHYLAVDLVFKVAVEKEHKAKSDLPLLRSIAVLALSKYPLEKASAMTVEELAAGINEAYVASYKHDNHEMPFVEAMISKLIIE